MLISGIIDCLWHSLCCSIFLGIWGRTWPPSAALLKEKLVLPLTHACVSNGWFCDIISIIQYSCVLFQSHIVSQYFDFIDSIRVGPADINGLETRRRSWPSASCTMTALLQQTTEAYKGFQYVGCVQTLVSTEFQSYGEQAPAATSPAPRPPPPASRPRSYAYGLYILDSQKLYRAYVSCYILSCRL